MKPNEKTDSVLAMAKMQLALGMGTQAEPVGLAWSATRAAVLLLLERALFNWLDELASLTNTASPWTNAERTWRALQRQDYPEFGPEQGLISDLCGQRGSWLWRLQTSLINLETSLNQNTQARTKRRVDKPSRASQNQDASLIIAVQDSASEPDRLDSSDALTQLLDEMKAYITETRARHLEW